MVRPMQVGTGDVRVGAIMPGPIVSEVIVSEVIMTDVGDVQAPVFATLHLQQRDCSGGVPALGVKRGGGRDDERKADEASQQGAGRAPCSRRDLPERELLEPDSQQGNRLKPERANKGSRPRRRPMPGKRRSAAPMRDAPPGAACR